MKAHNLVRSKAPSVVKPAKLSFKPRELILNNNDNTVTDLQNIYCKVKIGYHSAKTPVIERKEDRFCWPFENGVTVARNHNEEFAIVKIKDKNRSRLVNLVGEAKIELAHIISKGKLTQKYKLCKKGKPIGDLVMDVEYLSRHKHEEQKEVQRV